MKRTIVLLGTVLLLAVLVIGGGCERKVVIEQGDDLIASNNCFTCHGDEGILSAAKGEWQNSIHASGNNVDYTNRGGTDCTACHDHQGFLDFTSTGEVDSPYDMVSSIHCFTCHAPHTRGDLTLREIGPYTLINGDVFDHGAANLCVNCHHSRLSASSITADQSVNRYWGPHHGPQGDLLNASNGYEFAGYEYGNTGHANNFDNSGCIGCHMGNPRTHVGYKIGGHSFNMIDEESGATLVGVCETCHPEAEDYDIDGVQTEVAGLLEDLEALLFAAGIVDISGNTLTGTIADINVAGALFNYKMVEEDRSHGIHNPEYIIDLLESSIAYLESLGAKKLSPNGIAGLDMTPVSAH